MSDGGSTAGPHTSSRAFPYDSGQVRAATELAEARRMAAEQQADVVQNHLEALDIATKEKIGLVQVCMGYTESV